MYTCSKIGSMIGGVVFNYLGDRFGRKPIFWMTTFMVVIFMTVKTFLYKYYYVYAAFKILASGTFISIFQLPFSIICEVSDGDYRTWAILVSWLVWYVLKINEIILNTVCLIFITTNDFKSNVIFSHNSFLQKCF